MKNYRANPPGFKRLESGVYLKRRKKNHWIALFKIGSKWYASLIYLTRPPTVGVIVATHHDRQPGYATRALALASTGFENR